MRKIPFIVFAVIAFCAGTRAGLGRTFTATDGRTMEAEIIAATTATVSVKRADGRTFEFPLDRLSPADRTFVETWRRAQPKPAMHLDLSFRMQSKIVDQETGTQTGIDTKTERKAYVVVIENESFQPVPAVTVEYRMFVLDDQRGIDSRSDMPMKKTSGQTRLTGIPRLAETTFTTDAVELKQSKLQSGWVYADGSKRRIKDDLFGLWLRVIHDGKVVAEWAQPDTLPKKETW